MKDRRWQDLVTLVLGVWLFLSPFILQYADAAGMAAWNAYILSIGVVVFAGAALAKPQVWEEWVNLVLGLWLIISPFVLGFYDQTMAAWNHIIVGLLVGGDAVWSILEQRPAQKATS
ncbi:MAG: SPW repeat protein [Acidiferrobacterales bacterium]